MTKFRNLDDFIADKELWIQIVKKVGESIEQQSLKPLEQVIGLIAQAKPTDAGNAQR